MTDRCIFMGTIQPIHVNGNIQYEALKAGGTTPFAYLYNVLSCHQWWGHMQLLPLPQHSWVMQNWSIVTSLEYQLALWSATQPIITVFHLASFPSGLAVYRDGCLKLTVLDWLHCIPYIHWPLSAGGRKQGIASQTEAMYYPFVPMPMVQ